MVWISQGQPGTGVLRPFPVDDDTRGPDSVECAPGLIGGDGHRGGECLGDYTDMPHPFGFWCGCTCHDPEEDE